MARWRVAGWSRGFLSPSTRSEWGRQETGNASHDLGIIFIPNVCTIVFLEITAS